MKHDKREKNFTVSLNFMTEIVKTWQIRICQGYNQSVCFLCDWDAAQLHLAIFKTIPPKKPSDRQELEAAMILPCSCPVPHKNKYKSKSSNRAFAIVAKISLQRCIN